MDFKKVVQQARLVVSEAEESKIAPQLDEALKAVAVFDDLELTGVPPLHHPGSLVNVTRPDIVTPSFSQEEALQNVPESYKGFVLVPGVLEGET